MIEFKKYSSIENHFYKDYLDQVREQVPADMQWVVQEKVHGTNTSFLCDGNDVKFAKRTSILEDDEKFYDYQELVDEYKDKVISLFNHLKQDCPDMQSVSVFGELFGGSYPHPDVQRVGRLTMIQKGVYYAPDHEFYGFDIYVFINDGGYYLSVDQAERLFESEGFFYAKPLFKGTLDECLAYPNEFQSKNARFAENKSVKRRNRQREAPVEYSKELAELIENLASYVNENRLANVVSHIGEVHMPADLGKLIKEMSYEVVEDFLKEHSALYNVIDKSEIKIFNKELNKMISSLVKNVYMTVH